MVTFDELPNAGPLPLHHRRPLPRSPDTNGDGINDAE